MDVNYLTEVNGLDDWEMGNPLSATAYKVMRKLLMLANRQRFPEQITVTNTGLCALVGCSENSLIAARQQLIQRGLIEYRGKKKQTPVYTIHYFSHNPVYNRSFCGINRGINRGINGGIDGGIDGGNIPNKENTRRETGEEDIYNTIPMVDAGARERAFPTRDREITREDEDWFAWVAVSNALRVPQIREMYGQGLATIQAVARSDRYPLDLVSYAIEATARRSQLPYRAPLERPAEYTVSLLEDWKREGFESRQDVTDSRWKAAL